MNLLHYIQGRRKGIDAHRIEREAMQDDFLSEALEGFESVAGDHAAVIQQMERQIARRSQPKDRSIIFWLSAAAGIALIIGFGWYFLLFESPTTPVLSEALSSVQHTDKVKQPDTMDMTEQTVIQESIKAEQSGKTLQRESLPPIQSSYDMEILEDVLEESENEMVAEDAAPVTPSPPVTEEISKELQQSPVMAEASQRKVATPSKATRRIQGRVIDETGEPMQGVNIVVKNRATGVLTDTEGEFALDINDDTIIQASFLGYETQEIKPDSSQLLIAMHEDYYQLDEVVVVGYGTRTKRDVTASVNTPEESERLTYPEPVFGNRAYRKYLRENLIIPVDGECIGVKGRVQVRFSVNKEGKPYNLRIMRKLCDAADREAMRLITEGCDWTPGNTEVVVTVRF